jgi:polyphosphate kinase 2 (PPK2 family)
MSTKTLKKESGGHAPELSKQSYLVKLQRHFIKYDDKILVIMEGRDASQTRTSG